MLSLVPAQPNKFPYNTYSLPSHYSTGSPTTYLFPPALLIEIGATHSLANMCKTSISFNL